MKLRPVSGGFDPIGPGHAQAYAEAEWARFNGTLVDQLEGRLGGFRGRRVLDLGGGPGQYALEFARRGAHVTWHDVSRSYLALARSRAAEQGLELQFHLGYLEQADAFLDRPFDLVFNRICWYYCASDASFARLVHGLIRPGGAAYIDNFIQRGPGFQPRYWVNRWTGLKLGHPVPPPGRLEKLFRAFGDLDLEWLHRSPRNERLILARRSG